MPVAVTSNEATRVGRSPGERAHDGLFTVYRISFGPGIRQEFNEKYQEAKARLGIVTSLPPGPAAALKGTNEITNSRALRH